MTANEICELCEVIFFFLFIGWACWDSKKREKQGYEDFKAMTDCLDTLRKENMALEKERLENEVLEEPKKPSYLKIVK